MSFCPLLPDSRHLSCELDDTWKEKAREDIRYRMVLAARQALALKQNYDNCECVKAYGRPHDEREECIVCGRCIADEPGLKYSHQTYEEQGYCLECVMALENCGIEEIAGIFR